MKLVKKLAVLLLVLIVILLYIPKHLNPHFSMSRSIVIKAPVSEVFKRLPDFNEYTKWNPFSEGDGTYKNEVAGVGVGSTMSWQGERNGSGKMTLKSLDPNHKIQINMEFYSPMKGEGVVNWMTVPTPDGFTEFKWTFEQELPYFNRYFGLVMDKMMGKYFEKGLMTYKAIVEGTAK